MSFFGRSKETGLWQFKWHMIFVVLAGIAMALKWMLIILVKNGWQKTAGLSLWVLSVATSVAVLAAIFGALLLLSEMVKSNKQNEEKLDNIAEMLNRNRSLLGQISQAVRLSESAKEIAFRDQQRIELAEAALGKLHQHDFDAAAAMIKTMLRHPEYAELAEQLKKTAEKYRGATEEQRVEQIIGHIEQLCKEYLWVQAAAQVDNLLKTFPYSEKAKAMPQHLQELKDARKKYLLAAWDQAITAKDTDKSLEILKELDVYLTPGEGLALQESASTVFRTKLHNLGVQFALAVTGKEWEKALETGRQIVSNFPNSRMAQEIRGRMDALQERAEQ